MIDISIGDYSEARSVCQSLFVDSTGGELEIETPMARVTMAAEW